MIYEVTNRRTKIAYILTEEEYKNLIALGKAKNYTVRESPEVKLKNFQTIAPTEVKTTKKFTNTKTDD